MFVKKKLKESNLKINKHSTIFFYLKNVDKTADLKKKTFVTMKTRSTGLHLFAFNNLKALVLDVSKKQKFVLIGMKEMKFTSACFTEKQTQKNEGLAQF